MYNGDHSLVFVPADGALIGHWDSASDTNDSGGSSGVGGEESGVVENPNAQDTGSGDDSGSSDVGGESSGDVVNPIISSRESSGTGASSSARSHIEEIANAVHTWNNWFLIPASRPTMSMPGAQNKFVEVPGMNGSYDISNYLTEDVTFGDRSGSFEFMVDNDHADWMTIYREIATFLHGRRLRMILTDDPEWYYEGRFTLDGWKSDPTRSRVTISYRVAPFKYSLYGDFAENVYWDTFCFERDEDLSMFWHIELSSGDAEIFDIPSYGVRVPIVARLVSGSVTATLDTEEPVPLTSPGEVVTLGETTSPNQTTQLFLIGNGVVDIGWQKVSL